MSGEENTTLDLALRSREGDRQAFQKLVGLFERSVGGHIRVRVNSDEDARDVAQETWVAVWERIAKYNPEAGSFRQFVHFWAGIMIKRHYDSRDRRRKHECSVEDIAARASDGGGEGGAASWDRITLHRAHAPANLVEARQAATSRWKLFHCLLSLSLGPLNPPHQAIAFGFSKMLEYKPGRICRELSPFALTVLYDKLEGGVVEDAGAAEADMRRCFREHRGRLEARFSASIRDGRILTSHPELGDRIVGEIRLDEFFKPHREPAQQVAHWCEAVKKRVLSKLPSVVKAELLGPSTLAMIRSGRPTSGPRKRGET